MRRVPAVRLLATLGATLLLALAGAAQSAQTTSLLAVGGKIRAIAADGHLVAAHLVRPGNACDRVLLWKGSGKATSVPAGCNDEAVAALALAGTRVLWVNYDYGNHAYCRLLTATAARPRATEIDFCRPDEADTYLGGLSGDGPLLVFNDWFDFLAQGELEHVELRRVEGTRTKRLLGGLRSRTVTSVASGLIAIRGGAGAVTVVRSDGSMVHRFAVKAQGAKLDGARTVVIRTGATLTPWDLGSAVDGTPRRMKGGGAARFEDVQSGIAVYVLRRAVHLLRLADGRDVVIRRARTGPVHAQLEAPGLFWSHAGSIELVLMSALRSALR
jgi:hypothetical protein